MMASGAGTGGGGWWRRGVRKRERLGWKLGRGRICMCGHGGGQGMDKDLNRQARGGEPGHAPGEVPFGMGRAYAFAIFNGLSSQVVLGGLISSTLLDILVTPTLFLWLGPRALPKEEVESAPPVGALGVP